jgi:hypothetical protein
VDSTRWIQQLYDLKSMSVCTIAHMEQSCFPDAVNKSWGQDWQLLVSSPILDVRMNWL